MVQEICVEENHVQVNLSGSMYVAEAALLRKNLVDHITQGHKNFIIDLGAVDYIDASGLGTLLHIRKQTLKNDGSVTINGLQGLVKDLFEMTKVNHLFESPPKLAD